MASEKSYTITLNNNRTEKEATDYVVASDSRFWVPPSSARKHILSLMGLPATFARAFDLVWVPDPIGVEGELQVEDVDRISLVELKTTRKYLPELPRGFFFGATENEFNLARELGSRYQFCFVCLHPQSPGMCRMDLIELESIIKTKRTQFQINL